jgi:hypothetical protein
MLDLRPVPRSLTFRCCSDRGPSTFHRLRPLPTCRKNRVWVTGNQRFFNEAGVRYANAATNGAQHIQVTLARAFAYDARMMLQQWKQIADHIYFQVRTPTPQSPSRFCTARVPKFFICTDLTCGCRCCLRGDCLLHATPRQATARRPPKSINVCLVGSCTGRPHCAPTAARGA